MKTVESSEQLAVKYLSHASLKSKEKYCIQEQGVGD